MTSKKMKDEQFKEYFLQQLPDNVYDATIKLCDRFLEKHLQHAISYEQYLWAFFTFKQFLDNHQVSYTIPTSLQNPTSFPNQIAQGIAEFFKQTKRKMQSFQSIKQFRNKPVNPSWLKKDEGQSENVSKSQPKNDLTIDDKVIILFLAANPMDSARLRLGKELEDIREKLQLSQQREKFSLDSRQSVGSEDITQAIFYVRPQIVHFSGHGISTGEICFEDDLGNTQVVPPLALANLFELVKEQVNCVVLNACYSEPQAEAISKHIPYVIGMNQAISDDAAIAFSVGFYIALGAGKSFQVAYKTGCLQIQLRNIPEHLTPVLFHNGEIL